MRTFGYIFEGWLYGVATICVPLTIAHWRREDAEEVARAQSWASIEAVMNDVA